MGNGYQVLRAPVASRQGSGEAAAPPPLPSARHVQREMLIAEAERASSPRLPFPIHAAERVLKFGRDAVVSNAVVNEPAVNGAVPSEETKCGTGQLDCLVWMEAGETLAFTGRALVGTVHGRALVNGFVMADPHQLYPCYSAAGSLHALTIEALPAAIGDSGDHVARLPASLARRVMELQERRKRQNNGMELRSQQHQPVILRLRSLCHDGMDGLALAQPHYAKLFCPTVAQATATAAVVQSGPPSARRGKKRRLSAAAEEIIITGENKCLVDGFELLDMDLPTLSWSPLIINTQWIDFADALNSRPSHAPPPVLAICGAKNSGKSTCARFLVNSLLNSTSRVAYLDCDLGQPEFTPPGCVSMTILDKPLLGPTFTHLQEPFSSFYFGDTTPESDPTHYMTLVARLLKTYYGSLYASGIPLVINTGGWVHGIGLDLCVDLVRAAKCTHVCQLGERSALGRPRDMPDLVTMAMTERANAYRWLAASECSLRRNDGPWQPLSIYFDIVAAGPESERGITSARLSAPDHRQLMQLSYFHQLRVNADEPMQWDFATPLTSRTPLCVPVDSVRVTFTQHLIDADLVLRALNGCIVGLCSGADDEQVDLEHHDHSDDRDPRNDRGHSPLPCLGLGLVRAIDPVRRLLFVLTPLSADRLNQQHRLHEEQGAVHLVRGARQETSPCLLFQDQSLRDAAYAETTSPPTADVGGAVRKVRRNIQRRSRP